MVREIGPSADRVIIGRSGDRSALQKCTARALGLGSGSPDAITSLGGSARLPGPASPTKLTSWPPLPPTPYLGLLESMFWRNSLRKVFKNKDLYVKYFGIMTYPDFSTLGE